MGLLGLRGKVLSIIPGGEGRKLKKLFFWFKHVSSAITPCANPVRPCQSGLFRMVRVRVGVSLILLTGLLMTMALAWPDFSAPVAGERGKGPRFGAALRQRVVEARLGGEGVIIVNLLAEEGRGPAVARIIEQEGGKVLRRTGDFITFQSGPALVERLGYHRWVTALDVDGPVGGEKAAAFLPWGKLTARTVGVSNRPSPTSFQAAATTGSNTVDPSAFQLNLKAMHLPELRELVPVTGQGVTIALVDTGADPSRPELLWGPDGQRKISDWVDFSGEGDVETKNVATVRAGKITTDLGEASVIGLPSVSGRYHYGYFREDQIAVNSPLAQDINRNGRADDRFLVVVVDSVHPGVYDTVYVDTNQDLNLTDEIPMQVFRRHLTVAWFGVDRPDTPEVEESSFVVTEISPDGNRVNLGFDGNGHGTHVAGLAAGSAPPTGTGRSGLSGVAPGARLMILKALDSAGAGSWQAIFHALSYAVEKGARVLSVSVAGLIDESGADSFPSRLLEELGARYGASIILAAGNNGPGLGTAVAPAGSGHVVVVGGYVPAEMWQGYFGYLVPQDTLWYYSAVGPRKDGGLSPDLLAPAIAVSCLPRWLASGGYGVLEGTSMAVPQVAGGLANLLEAGTRWAAPLTPPRLKRALWAGAVPLPGYGAVEQGFGALNLHAAWLKSLWLRDFPVLTAGPNGEERTAGLVVTGSAPGLVRYQVANPGREQLNLELRPDVTWLRPEPPSLVLPGLGQRTFYLHYRLPREPGVYSSLLPIGAPNEGAPLGVIPNLVLSPYVFSGEKGWTFKTEGKLKPAQYRRYLLQVPPGTTDMQAELTIPLSDGQPRGRVRLVLLGPDGQEEMATDYIGMGSDRGREFRSELARPEVGLWQAIVYSSEALSTFGMVESHFVLRIQIRGLFPEVVEPALKTPLRLSVQQGQVIDLAGGTVNSDLSGGAVSFSFSLSSVGTGFAGQVKGVGLFAREPEAKKEIITISRQETVVQKLPTVPAGTVFLQVQVVPTSDPDVNLELYLYRFNPARGQWEKVAASVGERPGKKEIELLEPAPGQYAAYIEARGLRRHTTAFQLTYRQVQDGGQVMVEEPDRTFLPGQKERVTLKIALPPGVGDYFGYVLVNKTGSRERVALFPLVVEKDKPELFWETLPAPTISGALWGVVLRGFEPRSWDRAAGRLEVDGSLYELVQGRLFLPAEDVPYRQGVFSTRCLYGTSVRRYQLWRPLEWDSLPSPSLEERELMRAKIQTELGY